MTQPATITRRETARIRRGPGSLLWIGLRAIIELPIALYGLGTCGYLLARVAVGERWPIVAFANNFVPWWALGGLVCAGAALLTRHRRTLIALQLPVLVAFGLLYGHQFWPHTFAYDPADGPELTVATFNMQGAKNDPVVAARMLIELDADLVGLQEVNELTADTLTEALKPVYPYQRVYKPSSNKGIGLVSRYPFLDWSANQSEDYYARFARAVLDVKGTAVVVYVVHPDSPRNIMLPFDYDDTRRDEQLARVREYIAAENGPVLVLCDCNMTDQSNAYRAMDRLLDDTYREVGWGLGLTFPAPTNLYIPGLFPMLRLEYIWHNAFFVPVNAHVYPHTGSSDHYPVVAQLVLKQGVSLG